MKNNKSNLKKLPKGVKFATINSYDSEDIILEKHIATLIYNGYSKNQIYKSLSNPENDADMEFIGIVAQEMICKFIELNPEFAIILKT
ncbi:hypothetical protein [Flavobacterium sp. LB2P44]|uniref:hypothetical protein n=1 Tax=Flavobacterium sp. LB2P44 TaxID=3401713 RepID=UPI003AAB2CE9